MLLLLSWVCAMILDNNLFEHVEKGAVIILKGNRVNLDCF